MNGQPKNERQAIIPIAVGSLLITVIDYCTYFKILESNLHTKLGLIDKFIVLFHTWGEVIRALFILTFSLLCYLAYTNSLIDKTSFSNKLSRTTLIILSIVSSLIFIECFRLSVPLIKIVYPISLIISMISIVLLMASLAENILEQEEGTNLNVEKEPTEKEYGIALKAEGGYINIPNPFRSVTIIGGAGAGKSASLIEPILFNMIGKGFTGCIYDFKFPTLGDFAYSAFLHHNKQDVKFFAINFTELDKTNRFNPLDTSILNSSTYAEEFSFALYCNLDKEAKKGGFFPESASGLLKAVMWFMRKNHPEYCTLPHIINIILKANTPTLVNMVVSDEETAGMMKNVAEAAEKKAYDQLAGVIGSLTMQLQKINTPEIVWVLTGNDFTLDLNNPYDPKFVILGSRPDLKSALNPILAFIITIILKTINNQGKLPSVVAIDELPTLFVPGLDSFPATARSNKCCSLIAGQDKSQYNAQYNKDLTNALLANHAYQFTGNTSDPETAESISKMVGEEYRTITSHNKGGNSSESGDSNSRGVSYSQQKRKIVEVQEMFELKQGEFIGKLVESEKTWVRGKLKRVIDSEPNFELKNIPSFVENFMLNDNDKKIIEETKENYISNMDYYRTKSRDFNNLLISFKNDTNNNIFIKELDNVVRTKILNDKKQVVINENFKKTLSECQDIINMYTDTSMIDNLIK